MAWLWVILSATLFVYLLQQLLGPNNWKKLPPGPRGLPILGHFHLLGKNPHVDLCNLARKHGPVMGLRFGPVPAVVVMKRGEEKGSEDFVDTMMAIMESGKAAFEFDRRHIKAMLLDLLITGTDTSATAIEWAMSELMKHPTVMKKLQQELELVVGLDQMVDESHLNKLEYLDCVVKEALRLHPVVPLLIPHESMEDCELQERFIGSEIDLRGRHFELIPFGSGRRGCPGLQLGLTVVKLLVAQLAHCFEWELPIGMKPDDIDMSEHFGLVTARAKHLMAIPRYGLHVT
ncbi:cytochrome P450 71AU50-like [Salvia divinorum]|uniref:Cytochrome P450 71AU50-like n=1 Tax=Salvia divinorum TaxID=28513 RepID=A0ABD1IKA1_SALDI